MLDEPRFDGEVREELRRFPMPDVRMTDVADVAAVRSAWEDYYRRLASRTMSPRAGLSVEDRLVPSLIDDHAVPVRVYRPAAPVNGRALVYMHGGAFVSGDLDTEDAKCRSLALHAGCVVVSVDYRLAPEHPYPVPLEDCYSALQWLADGAADLPVDPRRIGVGGCSAGGALAAGLALLCRDRGGPKLALQMLLYPVLDVSASSISMRRLLSEVALQDFALMWQYYLNGSRSEPTVYAAPAACDDLSGLPSACIVVGELDLLRDQALAYAQRLLHADVSVELHLWPRVPHGFDVVAPGARISRDALDRQAAALARILG